MTLEAVDTRQYATGGEDPKADVWVKSNAPKFAGKYGKVRCGIFFIFGGKSEALTRFLNAATQEEIVAIQLPVLRSQEKTVITCRRDTHQRC